MGLFWRFLLPVETREGTPCDASPSSTNRLPAVLASS
jgi:hypothetical protein